MTEKIETQYKFKDHDLEELWYIMYVLSDSMFTSPRSSIGEKGTYFLSCENVMSVMNTLVSIDFCADREHFSDAFTLARKYRDDLMQYVYLLNVVSRIRGLSDEELNKYDITDVQSFMKMIETEITLLASGETKNKEQKAVEAWFYKELEMDTHSKDRKDYFDTSKYKRHLENSNDKLKHIMSSYFEKIWRTVDRKLNNYVHGNGVNYISVNYVRNIESSTIRNELIEIMKNITSIFLSALAMVDATQMRSRDYLDALEFDEKPIEGSQYWVAPCIVEYMEKNFPKIDKGLLQYIEDNNDCGMKFCTCDYE